MEANVNKKSNASVGARDRPKANILAPLFSNRLLVGMAKDMVATEGIISRVITVGTGVYVAQDMVEDVLGDLVKGTMEAVDDTVEVVDDIRFRWWRIQWKWRIRWRR